MSGVPSPFTSPSPETDEPKKSKVVSSGPLGEDRSISAVDFGVPSGFIKTTWTAPLAPSSPESSPGAPTAMSAVPSPSRSPMPATEVPNSSPSASDGPLAVVEFISVVFFGPPYECSVITCTAPRRFPPSSSPFAPTAMSGTPSPSTSPMPATEVPNSSSSASDGPFAVVELISVVFLIVPSEFIKSTCTAPLSELWPDAFSAPTAMSCTPSPSMSPIRDSDFPNWPSEGSAGAPAETPGIFDASSGYAQLWADEAAEPDCRRRWWAPGVFTVTAKRPVPGPKCSNSTRLSPASPSMRAPSGPSRYSNETSASGPPPMTVPS